MSRPAAVAEAVPNCEQCHRPLARPTQEGDGHFVKATGVFLRSGRFWCRCARCGREYDLLERFSTIRVTPPRRPAA